MQHQKHPPDEFYSRVFVYNPRDMRKFHYSSLFSSWVAAFVYLSFGELESILKTLQQGNFWFILLALLIQLGWFLVTGLTYLSLYRLLGLDGTAL